MDLFGNKSHESTEELISYEINSKTSSKLMFGFVHYCTFKHGDVITNLIKSQVYEDYKKGHTITPNTAKYVCFEVPEHTSLKELARNEVFLTLDKMGRLDGLKENSYNHIGFINRMDDGGYEIFNPTIEVLSYIEDNMNTKIGESDKLLAKRIKFVERISEPAKKQIEEQQVNRKKRKETPILEEQFKYKIGDKVYQDYKGIDVVDGRILKINRLSVECSTCNDILYSAFIEKVDNDEEEKSITLQNIPEGFPILFTLSANIEELLQDKQINGQNNILQLLSSLPKDVLTLKRIQYVGGIDKDGNIYSDIELCSNEVKCQIEKQQQEYQKTIEAELVEEKY